MFTKIILSKQNSLSLNFEKTVYLNWNFPIQWSAIITPERIQWRHLSERLVSTIATIAGKNVQQSLLSFGNHFLAIVANTAIIWKRPAYMETAQRSK